MSNPYLPNWEYVPDGEPRVFGDRVYIYGSHDRVACDAFCDFKLKVWSAAVDDLNQWVCHGVSFRTRSGRDGQADVDWSDRELFAPDVVEKDGKYYLYAYIVDSIGCVAVSNNPEGPFELIAQYQYPAEQHEILDRGWFIDPGVLVDEDGRVYIYCGFTRSYMAEINPDNMYEILDGSVREHIIPQLPKEEDAGFFEACSPRKIGDTYYLIYSPNKGSRLAYATSDSPTGPFTYRGYIIDNSEGYPGGNNHGSICRIGEQWYIFYHRMTNGTIMSRRGCVERIEILPDGSIPTVEMTSLGFQEALNPYEIQEAEIACYLTGGCFVIEHHAFERVITGIVDGCVIGYKYFDFGKDYGSKTMIFQAEVIGSGCNSEIIICLDDPEKGDIIGTCQVGIAGGILRTDVKSVTGRHAVFFKVKQLVDGPFAGMFEGRQLFEWKKFVFMK